MNKKKYFIYARSAVRNKNSDYSITKIQIQPLQDLAEELGIEIVGIYSEYGSGLLINRSKFLKMMRRLKKGDAQGILCIDWDRLTRDFVTFVRLKNTFEENNIDVITLNKDFDENLYPENYL